MTETEYDILVGIFNLLGEFKSAIRPVRVDPDAETDDFYIGIDTDSKRDALSLTVEGLEVRLWDSRVRSLVNRTIGLFELSDPTSFDRLLGMIRSAIGSQSGVVC